MIILLFILSCSSVGSSRSNANEERDKKRNEEVSSEYQQLVSKKRVLPAYLVPEENSNYNVINLSDISNNNDHLTYSLVNRPIEEESDYYEDNLVYHKYYEVKELHQDQTFIRKRPINENVEITSSESEESWSEEIEEDEPKGNKNFLMSAVNGMKRRVRKRLFSDDRFNKSTSDTLKKDFSSRESLDIIGSLRDISAKTRSSAKTPKIEVLFETAEGGINKN